MESLILTLRGVERSGALESRVREIHERLRRCNDRMTLCQVTIVREPAANADAVEAKIHICVPGAEIHASSGDCQGGAHTDVFLALRAAYDIARRQLRDLRRERTKSSLADAVRKLKARR